MTTFLQTPAGLAIMFTIAVMGIAACFVLALCVVAKWADAEIERAAEEKER
jgi:hypothetical protein